MKKYKRKSKKNVNKQVSDLASLFEKELSQIIDVVILPNNKGIKYKSYIIAELPNKNWGLFNLNSKEYIDEFYLKSSALMAAKTYHQNRLAKYTEIKTIDRKYWASYSDILAYQASIKSTKDYDRYLILLDKLEDRKYKNKQYKAEISKMFRWAFV